MSSINPHFTIQYSQPEDYRFSHDSVFLSRRVFEILKSSSQKRDFVLDLCSGCGVVGIDYLFHLEQNQFSPPEQMDFMEVQAIYHSHFVKNIAVLNPQHSFQFLTMNYSKVTQHTELKNKYDLILCNPPYFKPEMGVLSKSDFKNRCRFMIDSDFKTLIQSILYLLKTDGVAFVLIKDLQENGFSFENELQDFTIHLNYEKLEKIRDTDLYKIKSC